MDAKKKFHTSLELSIIKAYLFRGRLTDYSLHEQGTGTKQEPNRASRREAGQTLYIGIRGYAQVGR